VGRPTSPGQTNLVSAAISICQEKENTKYIKIKCVDDIIIIR